MAALVADVTSVLCAANCNDTIETKARILIVPMAISLHEATRSRLKNFNKLVVSPARRQALNKQDRCSEELLWIPNLKPHSPPDFLQ